MKTRKAGIVTIATISRARKEEQRNFRRKEISCLRQSQLLLVWHLTLTTMLDWYESKSLLETSPCSPDYLKLERFNARLPPSFSLKPLPLKTPSLKLPSWELARQSKASLAKHLDQPPCKFTVYCKSVSVLDQFDALQPFNSSALSSWDSWRWELEGCGKRSKLMNCFVLSKLSSWSVQSRPWRYWWEGPKLAFL